MSNPRLVRIDPNFHELCFKIQNERIIKGVDTSKDKMAITKITKIIANMINSNPKIYDALVEVENGKSR